MSEANPAARDSFRVPAASVALDVAADPHSTPRWPRALARPFWNLDEGRLRALWRVVALALVGLLLARAIVFILRAAGVPRQGQESPLGALFSTLIVLATIALVARLFERRSLRDFGMRIDRAWLADLGFGLALGALLMTLIFAVELGAGWITAACVLDAGVAPAAMVRYLGKLAVLFVTVGINEELVFRGYLLRTLADGMRGRALGPQAALVVSLVLTSVAFGLAHLGNPGATWASALCVTVAGVSLAAGYLFTGRLGVPIGMHFTWNYFQGPVYGFAVSGNRLEHPALMALEQRGPDFWTGGSFGPEAGLVGILAMGLGLLLVLAWVRWHEGRVRLCVALAEPPEPRMRAA